jgi:hypothetical protein
MQDKIANSSNEAKLIPVGAVGAQGVDRFRGHQGRRGLRLPHRKRVPETDRQGAIRGPRGCPLPAQQFLTRPYNFDFLTLASEAQERDLGLLEHLRQFLIEPGTRFAFRRIGSQSFMMGSEAK